MSYSFEAPAYKHVWRGRSYPVDAETAWDVFQKIDRENGQLTPKLVLENSRPEGATLHKCFEWNDSVAAEKYRLKQAHGMISNIMCVPIKIAEPEEKPRPIIRAWHNVSGQKCDGIYRPIEIVCNSEEMKKQVLKNAMQDLRDFERKYAALTELSEFFQVIDKLLEENSNIDAGPQVNPEEDSNIDADPQEDPQK